MKKSLITINLIFVVLIVFSNSEYNTPPVAIDDYYTVNENETLYIKTPGLLENDYDSDNESGKLTVKLTKNVNRGFLLLNNDGTFNYRPEHDIYSRIQDNNNDPVFFSYKVFDGKDYSNEAIVTITINQVNDPPVCEDDFFMTEENKELYVDADSGLLKNDIDPEGDDLYVELAADVSNGILYLNNDGSFTYIPNEGFSGLDRFTYYTSDGEYNSRNTIVNIEVEKSLYHDIDDPVE